MIDSLIDFLILAIPFFGGLFVSFLANLLIDFFKNEAEIADAFHDHNKRNKYLLKLKKANKIQYIAIWISIAMFVFIMFYLLTERR